jgi:hypothetical protein
MKTISDDYRDLNAELHERHGGYGSKGRTWAPRLAAYCSTWNITSLLDYGCGKGSLKPALLALMPTLDVLEYDPAVPGKDGEPGTADMVVCCDVLEHVEPAYIDAVVQDVMQHARKVALLAIACRPGKRVLANGKPDHITVQPPAWWAKRLEQHGRWAAIPSLRDREHCAVWFAPGLELRVP